MPTSLYQYEMLPTTWFYMSTFIILATFFKFNRFLSIRNLDLIGLVMFTPGMLLVAMGEELHGYGWLFFVGILMCIRLLFDTVLVRRPLLEPNLTPGGLTFACIVVFGFLTASISINRESRLHSFNTVRLEQILTVREIAENLPAPGKVSTTEPGYPPFIHLADLTSRTLLPSEKVGREILDAMQVLKTAKNSRDAASPLFPSDSGVPGRTSFDLPPPAGAVPILPDPDGDALPETPGGTAAPLRSTEPHLPSPLPSPLPDTAPPSFSGDSFSGSPLFVAPGTQEPDFPDEDIEENAGASFWTDSLMIFLALLSNLMIVLGFLYVGHCHFGNIRTGIACAMLYLLLPYTNQMTGRLDHTVPAALIVWAVAMYRRPFFSGVWLGLAAGLVFYPVFLFPLWLSFYLRRGWIRFLIGFLTMILLLVALLPAFPEGRAHFGECVLRMVGDSTLRLIRPDGFWAFAPGVYRIPVMTAFFVFCFCLLLWPSRKHLGTLLCCTALLMLGVQFWQLHQGGLSMAWYLPPLILTIFRPNLEDRVAQAVVVE